MEVPSTTVHDVRIAGPERPKIVAHRGASEQRAEHTEGAYALALEQGADALECDVRLTRDGHLICVHDRRVDRTSSGQGVVSTLSLERMITLDFGAWHDVVPESADELAHEPLARPSEHVARRGLLTLDALLSLIADHRDPVTLFVETKHPVRYGGRVEAALISLLARYGFAHPRDRERAPVVMMSFSARAVRRTRWLAPRLPTVLLFDRFLPCGARANGSLPPWADYAGPGISVLHRDPGYVVRAAEHGNQTYCWTVDDAEDVRLCGRSGVAYLATNHPRRAREILDDPSTTLERV